MIRNLRFIILMIFSFGSVTAFAQQIVQGVVTDANGETLIGVSVLEKGTTNGAITQSNGDYRLQVTDANAVLVFSFIGFETIERTVGNQTAINVSMKESATELGEVVVTAIGLTTKKDELGSTASTVKTEDVTRSGEVNFLNSLGAKASNVQINRSNGDPGAGSTIKIRGANSITGTSSPLIIVDGIPVSNNTQYGGGNNATGGRTGGVSQQSRLNDLNPNDIESVQILKGASAAALWGSRAANGVIVITTKTGKAGKVNVSYKFTSSFDQVNQRYEMQNVWGQGRGGVYGETRAEAWGDYIPDRSGGPDEVNTTGERFVAENGTVYYPITQKNSKETFVDSNWDGVFQNGGFMQHDVSLSAGTEKSTYFFSVSRLDQDGIIKESSYDRTNIRLNNRTFINDYFTLETKGSYTHTFSNRIQQSSNTAGLLLGLLRTPPDFDQSDYIGTYVSGSGEEFPLRHRSYRRYLGNAVNPTYNNPLWTVNEQLATSKVNRYTFSGDLDFSPVDFLNFKARGGIDGYNDTRSYFFPIGSAGSRSNGQFAEDILGRREINFDIIGTGEFQLTNDIALNATVGWNYNDRALRGNSSNLVGFLVNARKETTDLNTAAENSTISNSKTFIRSNRGYAALNFSMWDQLFVNLSGAVEASSTTKGSFTYPATDLAWQFTKLPALENNSILSFGKLRASWGRVGIAAPAHRFQTLAEGGFGYSTYSDPLDISLWGGGFRLDNNKGNPDLTPEIKEEWEIGTDLRFFDNKLNLTMTYYQNRINGIIIPVDLTPSSGFDTQILNAASMENKGFEMEMGYQVLARNDWSMNVFGNWATNENIVTDLSGTETIDLSGGSVSSRAIVGQPLGVLFGTGSQTNPDGSYALDANGFPQLTPSPIVLGDPNPDWRGGLGFDLGYKKWRMNVLFEHSQGGVFSPRSLWVLNRFGTTEQTANRMTLDQDLINYAGNTIAAGTTVRGNVKDFGGGSVLLDESWYRTGIGGGFGDNQAYNFSIYDATFTRLREVSIGWTLDTPAFKQSTTFNSITFTATGRNLFLWDEIPGIDPEVNQTGVGNGLGLEYFTNPSTRSFLFSVLVNF